MIEKEASYRAALYCRLSCDDSYLGESGSIQTQKALLTQYCEDNGFAIYDYYVDDGWSGTNFERPEFKRMLGDLEAHRANVVIVKDLSRFGREYAQMGLYIENDFEEWNIRFIAIGESIDTLNGSSNLLMPITNVINAQYAKECARKTKEAHRALAREGKYIGAHAPFGYMKDPQDRHHLLIDEPAARVVRLIFGWYSEGIGIGTIRRRLLERSILNPLAYFNRANPDYYSKSDYWRKDYDWHATSVHNILNNPVYLGQTVFGRTKKKGKSKKRVPTDESEWIVVEGTHEPIITQATWDLVHDIMRHRRRVNRTGEIQIFAGLVKCGGCGSSLNLSFSRKKNTFTNFTCWVYKNYGKERCTSHAIGYKTLYNIVLDDIRRQAQCLSSAREEYIAMMRERVGAHTQSEIRRLKAELKKAQKRMEDLDRILSKLYEDRALGKITEERYLQMSSAYEKEYAELKEHAAQLEQAITAYQEADYGIEQFASALIKYTSITELDARLLNELIEKIVVHEKQIVNGETIQQVDIYYKFVGML